MEKLMIHRINCVHSVLYLSINRFHYTLKTIPIRSALLRDIIWELLEGKWHIAADLEAILQGLHPISFAKFYLTVVLMHSYINYEVMNIDLKFDFFHLFPNFHAFLFIF